MFQARRSRRLLALLIPFALVLSACGGGKSDPEGRTYTHEEFQRGGSVTYGLEAETGDGWCLQEGQLAISGIMVARTLYDTLTAPNSEGEYVPYLAEAVEHNDAYDEWTITLRDGIKFHDGSDLTAEVVKNNLDAYRGIVGPSSAESPTFYQGREPQLFIFVLSNIDDVQVTGDLEVTVTTKVPWVAFPAFLYASGRLGITAQAQLDDQEACDRNLIGTGPFKLVSWQPDVELVAEKNPDYWQDAPDNEPYPLLDEIRFRPIVEAEQRINSLQNGDLDLMHASGAPDFDTLDGLAEEGLVKYFDSEDLAEVSFLQMNQDRPPMDDIRVRKAVALALDPEEFTEVINRGRFTMASGPFGPGSIGYLEDSGYPTAQDMDQAKALIAEYEAENGTIRPITYQATPGVSTQQIATYVQQIGTELGITVEIETIQQDALIDNAVAGDYDIMGFRNYPGGDPDELYGWFYGHSLINFAGINDPEINALLDEGRSEPDPARRKEIYQEVTREFGSGFHAVWANWTTWRIASGLNVHGYEPINMPKLPNGDDQSTGLAAGHPVHGLWVTDQ